MFYHSIVQIAPEFKSIILRRSSVFLFGLYSPLSLCLAISLPLPCSFLEASNSLQTPPLPSLSHFISPHPIIACQFILVGVSFVCFEFRRLLVAWPHCVCYCMVLNHRFLAFCSIFPSSVRAVFSLPLSLSEKLFILTHRSVCFQSPPYADLLRRRLCFVVSPQTAMETGKAASGSGSGSGSGSTDRYRSALIELIHRFCVPVLPIAGVVSDYVIATSHVRYIRAAAGVGLSSVRQIVMFAGSGSCSGSDATGDSLAAVTESDILLWKKHATNKAGEAQFVPVPERPIHCGTCRPPTLCVDPINPSVLYFACRQSLGRFDTVTCTVTKRYQTRFANARQGWSAVPQYVIMEPTGSTLYFSVGTCVHKCLTPRFIRVVGIKKSLRVQRLVLHRHRHRMRCT